MKKLLLALALIVCFTTANANGFGLGLGPKFGYQTTTLSLKKVDIEKSFKNSWTAGLFVRVRFSHFIIQPELMYFKSEKIFNIDGLQLQDFNPSVTLNQQNLALPILLGYNLFKDEDSLFKMRFTIGPVMYFVIKQDQAISAGNLIQDVSDELQKIKAQNFTWGAAVNVGIDIWQFTLDVSYSFGLSKIFKTENLNVLGTNVALDNTRQNMFMVTLGLRLFD